MNKSAIIQKIEKPFLKTDLPVFHVGDTVKVYTRIVEGDKMRTQVFMGTVIARSGSGFSETFSVHRVAYGEGMERVFPLHSPRIEKIEVVREGKVRRAKLYYLRGTSGKKAKVRALLGGRKKKGPAPLPAAREVVEQEAIVETHEAHDAVSHEAASETNNS